VERQQSGKRSGAGIKSGKRERSDERTFQKTIERERGAGPIGRRAESGLNRRLKVR